MLARSIAFVVASFLMITGALSQDGARAYHLLPEGTDIISLTATGLHTELPSGVYDVGVVTPSYRQSINVFGNAGAILIGMPIGGLSGSLMGGVIEQSTGLVQGDLFVGGVLGLVGSPSLSPMDFVQYKPGFRANLAAKLFLPTGAYDSDQFVNLGQNRWSLQASVPISYVLADSMIDPELMTFEIVPFVQIFGDNEDTPGPITVTSQEPIWGLEGHITRNFSPTVWASLDGAYIAGGETSFDGVAQGDALETLALGATLGLSLSPSVALRLSYEEFVYSSDPDTAARGFKATSSFLF